MRQSLDTALSQWSGEQQHPENISVKGRGVAVPSILLFGCTRQPGQEVQGAPDSR